MIGYIYATLCITLLAFSIGVEAKEVADLGITDEQIEVVLKGEEHNILYISIFGGLVPISNSYVLDARRINLETLFVSDKGRIVIRKYSDIPESYLSWSKENAVASIEYCGLTIETQNYKGVVSALVHNKEDSMVIASWDENEWKAAVEMYCRIENLRKKSSNQSAHPTQ